MSLVELDHWVASIRALADEGFGMLIAVDAHPRDHFELWFRSARGTTISTTIPRDGSVTMPSVASLGIEYVWKQQEIHEMFGITFDDEISNQPRLLADVYGQHPLRRDVLLKSRNETAWPGAKDPSDSAASPSRRKALPLGVSHEPGSLV